MDVFAVAGGLLGLLGGGVVGFILGRRFRAGCKRGAFWAASGGSLVLGVLVIFLGEIAGLSFIAGAGLGLMTGGLNGLRWGMGRLADATSQQQDSPAPPPSERERRPEDHRAHPAT